MKEETNNSWDILSKVPNNNSHAGLLKCAYEIKFTLKKELTKQEEEQSFISLNVLAEDTTIDNSVRAWCYNQLGLIYSGHSNLIKLK